MPLPSASLLLSETLSPKPQRQLELMFQELLLSQALHGDLQDVRTTAFDSELALPPLGSVLLQIQSPYARLVGAPYGARSPRRSGPSGRAPPA